MNVIDLVEQNRDYVIGWRRYFHQHPELSWVEHETSKTIQAELDKLGIPYEVVLETGIIGTIEGTKKSPVIGLRSDIDALPVQEQTGLDFASRVEGRMHACGHDAHMAILLGTAKILNEHKSELHCTVKLIFQPSEENAQGAIKLIETGKVDDVDNYAAIHVWSPIPVGKISVQAGRRMSACDFWWLTLTGKGGHGAQPQGAIDPIVAGAALVSELQSIVSREITPMEPAVLSVCSFNGGNNHNTIPGEVKLAGTTRCFSGATQDLFPSRIERIIKGVCASYRCTYDFKFQKGTLPVINDDASSARAEKALDKILPEGHIDFPPFTGGEDFSYFLGEKPGLMAYVGGGKLDTEVFPHHHEKFDIDEESIIYGTRFFVQYVLETMDAL